MNGVFNLENISSGRHHYVLTEDLHPLMYRWAKRHYLKAPNSEWFARHHQQLRLRLETALNSNCRAIQLDSHPYFYMVQEIHPLIYGYVGKKIWFEQVLSADPVYTPGINYPIHSLEITRAVDIFGQPVPGRIERPGHLSLEEQIKVFGRNMEGHSNFNRNVIFVDDGVWTGETLQKAASLLKKEGFKIVAVIVAIGANKKERMIDVGIDNADVHIIQMYDKNRPVEDWVCERDFYLGAPYGGRTVIDGSLQQEAKLGKGASIGAFYPETEKWLKNWASIKDASGQFRLFCFQQSIALFREVENLSGKKVDLAMLDRLPLSVAKLVAEGQIKPSASIADALQKSLEEGG